MRAHSASALTCAEMSISSARISMHEPAYLHALLTLPAVVVPFLSIVLVGNQIDSGWSVAALITRAASRRTPRSGIPSRASRSQHERTEPRIGAPDQAGLRDDVACPS